MKNMKYFLVALLMSSSAFAVSGGGNGGDQLVLSDDTIVLAEKYIVDSFGGVEGQEFKLPIELVAELRKVGGILKAYGSDVSNPLYQNKMAFIEKKILNNRIEYLAVDKIPEDCRQAKYANLPEGSQIVRTMCTEGLKTFVDAKNLARLNLRQMAVLFVHEGLHREGVGYADIGKITAGLEVLLDHYHRQAIGEETFLSLDEINAVEKMRQSLSRYDILYYEYNNEFVIHANGGGLISRQAKVDDASFIGIGSKVGANSSINSSKVMYTDCYFNTCALDEASIYNLRNEVTDKNSVNVILKKGSKIRNLLVSESGQHSVNFVSHDELGGSVRVKLENTSITLDEKSLVQDAEIKALYQFEVGRRSVLKRFTARYSLVVKIESDVQIENALHENFAYGKIRTFRRNGSIEEKIRHSLSEKIPFYVGNGSKLTNIAMKGAKVVVGESAVAMDIQQSGGGLILGKGAEAHNTNYVGSLMVGDEAVLKNLTGGKELSYLMLARGVRVENVTNFTSWFNHVLFTKDYVFDNSNLPVCQENEKVQFLAKESVPGKIMRGAVVAGMLGTLGTLLFVVPDLNEDFSVLKITPKKLNPSCVDK